MQLAAQNRNIRAIYKLGELHHEGKKIHELEITHHQYISGKRVPSNCEMSMEMYKNVAERGSWARFFMQAGNQYKNVIFKCFLSFWI